MILYVTLYNIICKIQQEIYKNYFQLNVIYICIFCNATKKQQIH